MSVSLFTSQIPAGEFFDGSPITLSTTVIFAADGTVAGGRFFSRSTNPGGTYEAVLWIPTHEDDGLGAGTILAQATYGAIVDGGWNQVLFSSPAPVVAGQPYKISLRTSLGAYCATSNFFSADLVNGPITGPQSNVGIPGYGAFYNGSFRPDLTGYPNQTFNATSYFVDVLYDEATGEETLEADLSANGSMAATLVNETSSVTPLGASGNMTVSDIVETTSEADLGASGSMTATLTVPSGPSDLIAAPVANALLTCLTEQMQQLQSPPARIQIRVGSETGPLIGPNVDECCAGLAWVRVANVYPSWNSFPGPDNDWLPCGPLAYAVVLEMGTAFCTPWSDSTDSFESLDPPSTDDWSTAFATLMQHQTLMRRAAACCFPATQRRAVGEWTPLSVEGGCTGGTLRVTVSVMAPCGDC